MADDKLQIRVFDGALPGERIMSLEGVLNSETAFRLRDHIGSPAPATLMIDMTGVRYVDSSGLGVLIGLYVSIEQTSRRLILVGINERVLELFRMCKIEGVFTRFGTIAEAEKTVEWASVQAK